jgi:beta-aspartyl-peptidase (threonine type)
MRSLMIHGGAWQIPDALVADHLAGVTAALERGREMLAADAAALDIVVEALVLMEDDPTFDAGRGSVLNQDGRIAMDASLMDGATLRAGACIGVADVRNPIRLARAILEDGRALAMAGEGASRFARDAGLEICAPEDLILERERERMRHIEARRAYRTRQSFDGTLRGPMGTVGVVCCDAAGNLAAGTSTGGAPYTLPGRVGDSGILGAGTWAENGRGAASATGWGEAILLGTLALRGVKQLAGGGRSPGQAARRDVRPPIAQEPITWGPRPGGEAPREAIAAFGAQFAGVGGLILLDSAGTPSFAFNTPRMPRGYWNEGMAAPCIEIEPDPAAGP